MKKGVVFFGRKLSKLSTWIFELPESDIIEFGPWEEKEYVPLLSESPKL